MHGASANSDIIIIVIHEVPEEVVSTEDAPTDSIIAWAGYSVVGLVLEVACRLRILVFSFALISSMTVT